MADGRISVEPFGAFRQSDAAEKLSAGSRFGRIYRRCGSDEVNTKRASVFKKQRS